MTQPNLTEPYAPEAIADYRQQAHAFLTKARQYLADNDLHQASEKGWGAAAWMAKAVAVAHGLDYQHHAQFGPVINHARRLSNNPRLRPLRRTANEMHNHFYTRRQIPGRPGNRSRPRRYGRTPNHPRTPNPPRPQQPPARLTLAAPAPMR